MRFREDTEDERARAREAVSAWRDGHPDGSPEEMVADLGPGFHKDYGPVLRAMLFRAEHAGHRGHDAATRRRAPAVTGPAVLSLARGAGSWPRWTAAFGDEHDLGVRDGIWWARRAGGSDVSLERVHRGRAGRRHPAGPRRPGPTVIRARAMLSAG